MEELKTARIDGAEYIEGFYDFFEQYYKKAIQKALSEGKSFIVVDFFDLTEFEPAFAEYLLEAPEDALSAAERALFEFGTGKNFRVRFRNLPKTQQIFIRDIRSTNLSKFIAVEGVIRLSSDVRPMVVSAKFECSSCGRQVTILQNEPFFKEPTICTCHAKRGFKLLYKEFVDSQRLIIEESPETLESGAQAKKLQVFLREDLVEPRMEKRTTPGTRVIVTGYVKEIPLYVTGRSGVMSTKSDLAFITNYIEPVAEDYSEIEISQEDEKQIKELASDPMIYEKLVNSIAPSIYGYEAMRKIKEAIVLQLFGGVRKVKKDGTITRGDLHILLVGDPGVAKSQLLTFVNNIAPKARYIAGKGATAAGVTATVVKDEFLRGWALEAGAIVLADKGILLLDEMDKMSIEDTSALHQAMEQQFISIAKANIQATLRAQTSILAAANPKFGRFNLMDEIAKQIDLPPALINRFDLIFAMQDIPGKEIDDAIATQVLKNQSYMDVTPEIPKDLFRKYIAYVKQKISPVLTEEAMSEIKDFYVGLRSTSVSLHGGIRNVPISARQLEAIVRLSEACAKIRLSNKVLKKDAKRAIDLMKFYLSRVGVDPETGRFDIDRIASGITASARSIMLHVRDLIFELDENGKKKVNIENELKPRALQEGIREDKFEEAIDKLKRGGDIFEPERGFVMRVK